MQAVIEIKGKQYLVSPKTRIRVATLAEEAGKDIVIESVILTSEKDAVNTKSATAVTARVLAHGLGKKIRVYKHHAKKRYRRTQGHRQGYTEIEITEIKVGK